MQRPDRVRAGNAAGRAVTNRSVGAAVARTLESGGRGFVLALSSLLSASLVPGTSAAAPAARNVHDEGLVHRPVPGVLTRLQLAGDREQTYYVYLPRLVQPGAAMVVTVHGISRNAREHALRLAPFAERYGVVLVAPLFEESRFPDYQRLGRPDRGERADLMLERIVDELARTTLADPRKLYLFGFSGGGQFVHRFAMAHPERVASYAVGAAGWYTFPSDSLSFPRGTSIPADGFEDVTFDAERYLRIPALVLVGERDNHQGSAMRHGIRLNRQQGDSRLERGEHWIAAMRTAAREHGYETRFEFARLQRSGHSFRRAATRGNLGEQVFRWFFGSEPAPVTLRRTAQTSR